MARPRKTATSSPVAEIAQGQNVEQENETVTESVTGVNEEPVQAEQAEQVEQAEQSDTAETVTAVEEPVQTEQEQDTPETQQEEVAEAPVLQFPRTMVISNISPTSLTIPQFSLLIRSGELAVEVVVKNSDQLNMAKLNIDAFNSLNRWDGVTAGVVLAEKKEDVE